MSPDLSAEQILGHTYPLLTPRAALRPKGRADCTYARSHDPDFLELLVHQDGECVRRLTDRQLRMTTTSPR